MSLVLFLLGIAACVATITALVRVRHPSVLSLVVMMLGWLAGELALFHIALQAIVTVVLVSLGALNDTMGWVGLLAMCLSWIGLVRVHQVAHQARDVFADVLADHDPEAAERVRDGDHSWATLRRPFSYDKSGIENIKNIEYGPAKSHRLDIYRSTETVSSPRPIMIYIHGGGWVSGNKEQQALPMLHELARQGWLAVTVNYRLGPKHRFPAPYDDVRLALEWVNDNAEEYGGDAGFIAVSGGSAGGHLAAMVALTAERRHNVVACVPIYGAFDFTDHLGIRGYARMRPFLERMVMATKLKEDRDGWEATSPIHITHPDAPAFFVIQGTHDVLVWKEETRAFVERLSDRSANPVIYAELPGTQHAFDLFHSVRSAATVDAIIAFLESVRARALTPE